MKHNRFIPRSKPTYQQAPDAVSSREHAGFTPWRVDCVVYNSFLDHEPTRLVIFCRAPSPAGAMHAARFLWGKQIKEAELRSGQAIPEFPKMDDRHETECLDEAEYMRLWKDAQNWPRVWAGSRENPLAFIFFPDSSVGRT